MSFAKRNTPKMKPFVPTRSLHYRCKEQHRQKAMHKTWKNLAENVYKMNKWMKLLQRKWQARGVHHYIAHTPNNVKVRQNKWRKEQQPRHNESVQDKVNQANCNLWKVAIEIEIREQIIETEDKSTKYNQYCNWNDWKWRQCLQKDEDVESAYVPTRARLWPFSQIQILQWSRNSNLKGCSRIVDFRFWRFANQPRWTPEETQS